MASLPNDNTDESTTDEDAAVFPLLAEPENYLACQWDLTHDAKRRAYWLNLYRTNFPGLLEDGLLVEVDSGRDVSDVRACVAACSKAFYALLDAIDATPTLLGRLDIISVGIERERILREHGFADPYRLIKQSENETALALLPALLKELDAMSDADRALALVKGVFAGNIFDVGAVETLELFKQGKIDFHSTRAKLKARPWLFDDGDAWLERMSESAKPYNAAVLFVDNAGCDIVLGMLPFARELLRRGTHVIITSNTSPSLNDMTQPEMVELVDLVCTFDATLAAAREGDRLELIPSGNGTPLIDLSRITLELADAVSQRGVDLVVLEGMGRAAESNFEIPFACDVIKVAMLKDPDVATSLGGELYDLVFRFEHPGK